MNEYQMREIFREMRDEPIPPDSLVRVRAGLEKRIGEKSWISAWKIAAALAMAACIAAGFLLLRPVKRPVPILQPPAAEIAQVLSPAQVPVRSLARPKRRVRAPETVPVLIRIETPDPDVVILLVN